MAAHEDDDEKKQEICKIEWFDLPDAKVAYQQMQEQNQRAKKHTTSTNDNSHVATIKNNKSKIEVNAQAHERQSSLEEEYKVFESVDGATIAKTTIGSSATTSVVVYGIDLAIEQAFLSTVGAELSYAGALVAAPALAVGGVAAAGLLAYNGYQWIQQKNADVKLNKTQQYNLLKEQHNEKVKEFKEISGKLNTMKQKLKEQLINLENEMSNCEEDLMIQRYDLNGKIIMLIGPTGHGKSMVAHRLIGDKNDCYDIRKDSVKSRIFEVAQNGATDSCTGTLECQRKGIKIDGNNVFNLSVVDTPGAFDSKGRSDKFYNQMSEYMAQIGGVNMFAVFFKFGKGNKFDDNYQKLLILYEKFWGNVLWDHCAIFITMCDRDSKNNRREVDEGLPKTKEEIRKNLVSIGISANVVNKIPMFEFGDENFETSVSEVLTLLAKPNERFFTKHECDNIKSPIKQLWDEITKTYSRYRQISETLNHIKKAMKELEAQIK